MSEKKEAKTRTSITIDPAVLEAARKHCEAANISVSAFIETAVSEALGVAKAVEQAMETTAS